MALVALSTSKETNPLSASDVKAVTLGPKSYRFWQNEAKKLNVFWATTVQIAGFALMSTVISTALWLRIPSPAREDTRAGGIITAAKSDHVAARLQLSFAVDRSGHVLNREIVRSFRHRELDNEVMSMIERAQPAAAIPGEHAAAPGTFQYLPRSAAPCRVALAHFCFFWAETVVVGRMAAQGSFAFCSGILLIVAL